MALHISNAKADRLARKVAKLQGRTVTDAVIHALESQLASDATRKAADRDARKAAIMDAVQQIRALPVRDTRSDEDILGYDEQGLPG
ncbi:MAG: type II toxin-antitoxin system VapB family antitoxin [Rhizomicrobium sp.]